MEERPPLSGIATDAAHSQKMGITEYKGVDIETGELLFYEELGNQTVNIGEFLAVVEAVKYIIETDFKPRVIFTDSMTAISWFKARSTASNKRCRDLEKAEIFLRVMEAELDTIEVRHWNNANWGETPADFGNK